MQARILERIRAFCCITVDLLEIQCFYWVIFTSFTHPNLRPSVRWQRQANPALQGSGCPDS